MSFTDFLNMIYILVYIDLILSTFFQHSNILTRASHHWCLASNIVLVDKWISFDVGGGENVPRIPGACAILLIW